MPIDEEVPKRISGPWRVFLRAVDDALARTVEIHCIGGFALTLLIDRARPTGDVDFIRVVPHQVMDNHF